MSLLLNADGQAPQSGNPDMQVACGLFSFNGTIWDRYRIGPQDLGVALTLTAQGTGTVNGPDMINYAGSRGKFFVNVSAATGNLPTTVITVQGKDSVSGTYYNILVSAALAGVTTQVLSVASGLIAVANVAVNDFLPRIFRVNATVAGTSPVVTATVGAVILP